MKISISSIVSRRNLQLLSLSTLCVVASFALGIQTAGEVQPVTLIEAGSISRAGDVNGSGELDLDDVVIARTTGIFWRSQQDSDPELRMTLDYIGKGDGQSQTVMLSESLAKPRFRESGRSANCL